MMFCLYIVIQVTVAVVLAEHPSSFIAPSLAHTTPTTSTTITHSPTNYVVDRVLKSFNISANSTIRITSKLAENDKFLVFEAHCRVSKILMSFVPDLAINNYVNSTGPALVYTNDETMTVKERDPGVFIMNPHNYTVVVLAMVKAYTATDPVPGLCNTKFDDGPRPFLKIDWDSAVIRLNFSRASLQGISWECNNPSAVQYRVYHRYLPRNGWGEGTRDDQFENALKTFSEITDIEKWEEVNSLGAMLNRLVFASYPPMGSLYAVIAEQGNGSSVYALGHSYGCHVDHTTGECPDMAHTVTKVVCAFCIFMGIVMAFAGHRFFMTSQFLFGFYAGSFVGYIMLSNSLNLNFVEIFSLTTLCGLILAIMVSGLWFFLGIPVLSVLLPTLEVGIIVSSCILFLPQMNIPSLTTDLYYWLVFLCLMLAIPVILLAFTQKASILSCVIVGSTTLALPMDYFLGTGLRFIFINVVRRATKHKFHEALVVPTLQTEDLVVVLSWLVVSAAGLITQLLVERRRPPFPPAPFQQWRWRREVDMEGEDGETAPLLTDEDTMAETVSSPVVGYILGHRPVTGIPQASPVTARTGELLQGRSRSNGVSGSRVTGLAPVNSSSRGRDIFKPPSPEESRPYMSHYSPRQGEEWVGNT